jgi:hypothetical protein
MLYLELQDNNGAAPGLGHRRPATLPWERRGSPPACAGPLFSTLLLPAMGYIVTGNTKMPPAAGRVKIFRNGFRDTFHPETPPKTLRTPGVFCTFASALALVQSAASHSLFTAADKTRSAPDSALAGGASVLACAYSSLWGAAGEAWNPAGRLPDFAYAGYHAGEAKIPAPPASTSSMLRRVCAATCATRRITRSGT